MLINYCVQRRGRVGSPHRIADVALLRQTVDSYWLRFVPVLDAKQDGEQRQCLQRRIDAACQADTSVA